MKNYGKIPPHFLYTIESEGIQISEMKSSNLALKESFDRMILKVPYCNRTLDIQVIFDSINISNPPDFILIKEENLLLNYTEIIKDWNFKDSSTLHHCLLKLKNLFSLAQEKRLKEEIEKNAFKAAADADDIHMRDDTGNYNHYKDADDFSNAVPNLWKLIDKVFFSIKSKMSKYKNVDLNNLFANCETNNLYANSSNSFMNSSFNASGKKPQNSASQSFNNANNNNTNLSEKILENLNKKSSNSNINFASNKDSNDHEEIDINEIPASHEVKKISAVNSNQIRTRNQSNLNSNSNNNINSSYNNIMNTPNSNLNSLNESNYNNNFNNIFINNTNITPNNNNNYNYPLLEILPEISFSYNQKDSAAFLLEYTEYKNFISFAYPLDLDLRCRSTPRFPYVLVTIYLNYDFKFKLELLAPSFINISNFKNFLANKFSTNENFDLKNYETVIEKYENCVLDYFRDMACREAIVNKILNLNLGFTLEVDSASFRKFSQYIHCSERSNFKNFNFNLSKKASQGSSNFSASPNPKAFPFFFNFIVCYSFDKDDAKVLQVNIIDSDLLSNISNKKFSFNSSDLDNLINNVFEFLISNVNSKLNQS